MSAVEIGLCNSLLSDYFGDIVAKVGTFVCQNSWQPLRFIVNGTSLKYDQVRKALCVLIQHKFAKFQIYKRKVVEYRGDAANILRIIFYPQIIHTTKLLYGDIGELLVEEILQHGISLMSSVMRIVVERLEKHKEKEEENVVENVQNTFKKLVQTHFLCRDSEVLISEEPSEKVLKVVPELTVIEGSMYVIPFVSQKSLKRQRSLDEEDDQAPDPKRLKSESREILPDDDGIYWCINFSRFDQFFRDQEIYVAVNQKHGAHCGEIVRAMLRISEVTTSFLAIYTQPISGSEIKRALPSGYSLKIENIEQYLQLLASDSDKIVEVYGEGSGNSYVINLKNAKKILATASVLSYIQERYGSKSCRIFRLLLMKKHLEQKQVEELAMIPGKEAKEYLYNMFSDNAIVMQEIPRTPDHAPSRTFYLFSVNMLRISSNLLAKCRKSVTNVITKHRDLMNNTKRLLEKQEKVNSIRDSLVDADEEELEDIAAMISPDESAELSKYKNNEDKLLKAQQQVAKTIFVLSSYLEGMTFK